jgi:hypothetical protein
MEDTRIKNEESHQESNPEFLEESMENIVAGAKVFTETASDIFNRFLEGVKETASSAYEKGTEIVETVTLTAQGYVERYRDRSEMASLKKLRDEIATQLGNMCYLEYNGRYRIRQEFQKTSEFRDLMKQMKELDKQIIRIGERLDQEK